MSGGTSPELVAAVSNAGGLGIYGASQRARFGAALSAEEMRSLGDRIRALTTSPFGLNLLLFDASLDDVDTLLACRPRVLSTAWRRPDQDLGAVAQRAHAAGALFMHQADTLDEAQRGAEAGVDIIVAQAPRAGDTLV